MFQSVKEKILSKISIYEKVAAKSYGVSDEVAKNIVSGELESYMTRLQNYVDDPINSKNGVPTLTDQKGVNIFLEVIQSALSFSQIANHVYISRLKGSGSSITYKVTVDGEVYQAQKAGAIDHLSEPTLVHIAEEFNIINSPDGRQIAQHVMKFDGRPAMTLDAFKLGYIYIVYPNGDRELSWISGERMKQLAAKSLNKNLYNDESFLQTKVILHALRKVRKTPFMQQLQENNEEVIQNNMEFTPDIEYTNEKQDEPF